MHDQQEQAGPVEQSYTSQQELTFQQAHVEHEQPESSQQEEVAYEQPGLVEQEEPSDVGEPEEVANDDDDAVSEAIHEEPSPWLMCRHQPPRMPTFQR